MKLQVKYHADIEPLVQKEGCDWIDLRAAEDVELFEGNYRLIPLGISVKLPKGYEAHIVPRSSTFKTWGIVQTNSMGVIDESYCGNGDEWMMPVYATKMTRINKNDRICQFRIVKKMPNLEIEKVETLSEKNRGGFGSTGIK
ncbi:MAG TPA: deoxyuridine 5'-triphosphate nucleotidohydrolase [[Clostridium] spiroforme]|uniref:dUTP diphosphatase n=1 Tax=Thomasclavelia spiroformis TaxID=29348 RepID=A0A921GBI3_9FIRM|nr:deoxyuridine 5'-triphosphate nucleotidohydrolase [Thomasclavelia spiroformis]